MRGNIWFATIIAPLTQVIVSVLVGAIFAFWEQPSLGEFLTSVLVLAMITVPIAYAAVATIGIPMFFVFRQREALSKRNYIYVGILVGTLGTAAMIVMAEMSTVGVIFLMYAPVVFVSSVVVAASFGHLVTVPAEGGDAI